jgi:hypothetical protein
MERRCCLPSGFGLLPNAPQSGLSSPLVGVLRASKISPRFGEIPHLSEKGPYRLAWRTTMSSALYAVGYLLLVVGVSYLAHLSHIPDSYIFAIDLIMLGIGVMMGIENAHQKDSNY